MDLEKKLILIGLSNKLKAFSWYLDKLSHSRIRAHRKSNRIKTNNRFIDSRVHVYPAFNFQLRSYYGKLFLVLEYSIEVKNVQKLSMLNLDNSFIINKRVNYLHEETWKEGRIHDVVGDTVIVSDFESSENNHVSKDNTIPRLTRGEINALLGSGSSELEKFLKKESLLLSKNPSRERSSLVLTQIARIKDELFPLQIGEYLFDVNTKPQSISFDNEFEFDVLSEPKVEFRNHQESANIRDGITSLGSYDRLQKVIKLIPICMSTYEAKMKRLIHRLQIGKYKYKGAEKTFSSKFHYDTVISVQM